MQHKNKLSYATRKALLSAVHSTVHANNCYNVHNSINFKANMQALQMPQTTFDGWGNDFTGYAYSSLKYAFTWFEWGAGKCFFTHILTPTQINFAKGVICKYY